MAQSFFCKINGGILGPFSSKQLRSMAIAGKLLPDSLLRLDGSDKWIAAGKINNLEFSQPELKMELQPGSSIPPSPRQPHPRCTHCGKELGLFRGLEGRKILCNHCNKITVVLSKAENIQPAPRRAPSGSEVEVEVEVVGDENIDTISNGRSSPSLRKSKVVYCGFWERFLAACLDGFFIVTAGAIVGVLAGVLLVFLGLVKTEADHPAMSLGLAVFISLFSYVLIGPWVGVLYHSLLESSAAQATWGKKMMGLCVVNQDGNKISFLKAMGRHFGKILSSLFFLVGYLMQPFTEKKQALHDILAGTFVVKK